MIDTLLGTPAMTGASFDAARYAVCRAPRAATTMVLWADADQREVPGRS
jgi:hypothetical protein